VSGQDIGDDIPTDQHVCADTIIKYTLFGFPGSTVEWYVDDVHLTGKDVVVPNNTIDPPASGGNVIHGGLTYNRALLNYTWSLSGGNTIENHSLKIQEISADPAACSTGVSNPGLAVHVHKKPILVLPVPTHAVCASDKGSLSVSVTATVPAALQLQYKLVNVTASSETDWINDNLNHIFNDLDPAIYKVQIRYVLSTDNSIVVKGSWSESADVELRQEDNTDPFIPILSDVEVECSATVSAPTTTDNCAGTITGTTTDPLTYTAQGTYVITWNFDDGNGNDIDVTQNVIINDVTDPVIPILGNVTGECAATAPVPTTTDNCTGTITGTTTDPLTYTTQGTHVITWNFDDGNGNDIDVTQNVIINDETDPVLISISDLSIEDCADDETAIPQVKVFSGLELPVGRYSDNCSSAFTVQYRIQLPNLSFENNYGEAATGASISDPSGFEFPEGESTIFFMVIDESGNQSNIESYTIKVNHKPNTGIITY